MLITTHSIVAGTIGQKIGNPFIAFFIGIIIHFILDSIPHYDTVGKGKLSLGQILLILADLIFGVLIVVYFIKIPNLNSSFVWGAIGGNLPDIFDSNPFVRNWFRKTQIGKKVHKFHDRIQKVKTTPFFGILVQIVLSLSFSFYLLSK